MSAGASATSPAGWVRPRALLHEGIGTVAGEGQSAAARESSFAFFGLPAYGEDSATTAQLDAMPSPLFDAAHYRCGNDMVCSWAGSLACADGISVIAGTGSMAYGEYAGRMRAAGGWGELIGDEGSAYWIAREGMNLFSRMSDGRAARGPLYGLVRERLGLDDRPLPLLRASTAPARTAAARSRSSRGWSHEAAQAGDARPRTIFARGAGELVGMRGRDAPRARRARRRRRCRFRTAAACSTMPALHGRSIPRGAWLRRRSPFEYRAPRFPPAIGAALYAARLAGSGSADARTTLRSSALRAACHHEPECSGTRHR